MHHNPCFNLFILHNIPFDNQGSEINKNDIFLLFDIPIEHPVEIQSYNRTNDCTIVFRPCAQ